MFGFLQSPYMPCPDCGASLADGDEESHVCDPERRVDFELVRLRAGILTFEYDYAAWLRTPHGRFALWLAERTA
jgi:hypothetical protein